MKSKFVILVLIVIPVLVAKGVLIFSSNTHFIAFAALVLLGAFSGIFERLLVGYIIPTKSMFKMRFLIHGIALGIFGTLLALFSNMSYHPKITWNEFTIMLIIGQIVMIPVSYITSLISSNILRENTKLSKNRGEFELMSDRGAYSIEQGKFIPGRLILTNQRLCFRSKKMDFSQNDLILSETRPEFEEVKYLGMPAGFSIKGKNMKIRVNYPLFWKREIMTQIQLNKT